MCAARIRLTAQRGILPNQPSRKTILMKNYIPQAGSVAARVCRYFLENPSEELSAFDIRMKFHTGTTMVSSQMQRAVETGLLVLARNGDGDVSYGPGPDIGRLIISHVETDNTPTPVNPTTDTTMPAKQLPAKRAKASKRAAKDEDYATPYVPPPLVVSLPEPPVPPVLPPLPEEAKQAAPGALPVLIDCAPAAPAAQEAPAAQSRVLTTAVGPMRIDKDVPIPSRVPYRNQHGVAMQQLMYDLQPDESAEQPITLRNLMNKAMTKAHKEGIGKYTTRIFKDKQTVRVWRKE